jgi:hypothetical protein
MTRRVATLMPLLLLFLGACSSPTVRPARLTATAEFADASPAAVTEQPGATGTPTAAGMPTTAAMPESAVFFATSDGAVYRAGADGQAQTRITTLPDDSLPLALSPDGSALAFRQGDQLLVRRLDTGQDSDITPPLGVPVSLLPGMGEEVVRWAPDSRSLLYVAALSPIDPLEPSGMQIYRATLDGQPVQPLAAGFAPVWSPTGERIAYFGPPFAGSTLHGGGPGGVVTLAAADGSDAQELTDLGTLHPYWQPLLWSADGTRLAVGDYLINADDDTIIAEAPEGYFSGIQHLTADGRAFSQWRNVRMDQPGDEGMFVERDELIQINVDGQSRMLIQTEPNECPCMPLAGTLLRPYWSPDGTRFFIADPGLLVSPEIPVYSAAGQSVTTLPAPEWARFVLAPPPVWQAEGEQLLVTLEYNDERREVWRWPLDGSNPQRIGEGTLLGLRE